jgi:hypothetical protein
MIKAAIAISIVGLALTVIPSILVFYGLLQWREYNHLMAIGMLLWFASAPVWMRTVRR